MCSFFYCHYTVQCIINCNIIMSSLSPRKNNGHLHLCWFHWLLIRQRPTSWRGRDVENHVGVWAGQLQKRTRPDCPGGPLPGHALVFGRRQPEGEPPAEVTRHQSLRFDTLPHFLLTLECHLKMGLSLIGKAVAGRWDLVAVDVSTLRLPAWSVIPLLF